MKYPQVHWYQGLFLRPQHLQAQDNHWREQLAVTQDCLHAFSFGLYEFDATISTGGKLTVDHVRARMRDGTLISIDGKDSLKADVSSWFEENKTSHAEAFIIVSPLKSSGPNLSTSGVRRRFQRIDDVKSDENGDAPDEKIDLRKLDVRLDLRQPGTTAEDDTDVLRVGKLSKGKSKFDEEFVPALLAMNAWSEFHEKIIAGLLEEVDDQAEHVANAVGKFQFGNDDITVRDNRRLWLLDRLNMARVKLFTASGLPRIHPYEVYRLLAEIVGELSLFAKNLRAPAIPAYNHDDPKPVLTVLTGLITELMRDDINLLRCDFSSDDEKTMYVTLDERWFHPDRVWYLGVRRDDKVPPERMTELEEEWNWDQWIFQTPDNLTSHHQKQHDLLAKSPAQDIHPDLPPKRQWTFYRIDQQRSLAWNDISKEHKLAMMPQQHKKVHKYTVYFEVDDATLEFRFTLFGSLMNDDPAIH